MKTILILILCFIPLYTNASEDTINFEELINIFEYTEDTDLEFNFLIMELLCTTYN